MPGTPPNLISYLRVMVGAWRDDPRDDAELLKCYAETRSDMAFAALVWRHGTIVWRACRHVLGNTPDAEDAFQSTFLALSRKANRLRRDRLAGWLHRVARQAALDVRAKARRRQNFEQKLQAETETKRSTIQDNLYEGVDEELNCLPEKLRVPLLLHYMEGKSQVEVARIIGCARRTLQERLEKGEAILRERLERRGLTLGALSVAALLSDAGDIPAIPGRLIENTARAAAAFNAGSLANGVAAEGAEKLLRSLTIKGVAQKFWWMVLIGVCSLGIGEIGLLTWKMFSEDSDVKMPALAKLETPEAVAAKVTAEQHSKRTDCYGDPLPEGAIARIGTLRFRSGSTVHANTLLETMQSGDGDAAFLPDGKTLVSVHCDGIVHFWEAATGKEIRRLEVPAYCRKVAVSSDGKKLAIIGSDEPGNSPRNSWVWAWDFTAETPRQLWRPKEEWLSAIVFAPNCQTLAVATSKEVRLFDIATGKVRHVLKGNSSCSLVFSHDGKTLAAGGRLWDVETGAKRHDLKELLDERGDAKGIYSATFSHDDKAFAAAYWDGPDLDALNIWDVETGVSRCLIDPKVHKSFVAFLPDGRTLLENKGAILHFWDSTDGKTKVSKDVKCVNRNRFQADPVGICLSSDGKFLARASGATVDVWDITTGQELGPAGANRSVRALALSPDSKSLVTMKDTTELNIWEADTGRFIRKLMSPTPGFDHILPPIDYDGHRITVPVFFGGRAIGGTIGYDARTGELLKEAYLPPRPVKEPINYDVSPDGRWQLWMELGNFVLVDRSTGKEIKNAMTLPTEDVGFMSLSADGRSVLFQYVYSDAKSRDKITQIEIWSTLTGKRQMNQRVNFPNFEKPVTALSPDGRWVAFVAGKKLKDRMEYEPEVQLWEVATGTLGEKFRTDGAALCSVAWSPDGRILVGGDVNGDLWLWDAAIGLPPRHITGHRGGVRVLVFSLGGRRLVSGSYDTTALIWDLPVLARQERKTLAQLPAADDLWSDLRGQQATKARSDMRLLTQDPDVALPLLRDRLKPMPMPVEAIAKLLVQLDDPDFQVRNRAKEQLAKMGERIEPILQETLAKKPSLEVKASIGWLLSKIAEGAASSGLCPEQLQAYRGVEVLERIGTPAARQILEELSRLPASLVQAEEAKAALQRLTKQTPASVP